jgi:hypothetical protein
LERAGIPYQDDDGRYAEFHALRHTSLTNLANSGAAVEVVQTLARHSTITLTMDRYAHVVLHQQVAALDGLLPLPTLRTDREVLSATGTDGQMDATDAVGVLADCLAPRQRQAEISVDSGRQLRDNDVEAAAHEKPPIIR